MKVELILKIDNWKVFAKFINLRKSDGNINLKLTLRYYRNNFIFLQIKAPLYEDLKVERYKAESIRSS